MRLYSFKHVLSMLGHVLSMLKPKVGPERACWSQKGCFGELLVRLGVPRGRLREALGSSRGALWSSLGCFRSVSGRLLEAFAGSDCASEAEKVKSLELLYFSSENKLFEVPEAPELDVLSSLKRVLEAKQASGEHAGS